MDPQDHTHMEGQRLLSPRRRQGMSRAQSLASECVSLIAASHRELSVSLQASRSPPFALIRLPDSAPADLLGSKLNLLHILIL